MTNLWCTLCSFIWPRDLFYVRYWRRNDDGSYGKYNHRFLFILVETIVSLCLIKIHTLVAVVLFRSREHKNCNPLPGYVRAHIESNLCFPL